MILLNLIDNQITVNTLMLKLKEARKPNSIDIPLMDMKSAISSWHLSQHVKLNTTSVKG